MKGWLFIHVAGGRYIVADTTYDGIELALAAIVIFFIFLFLRIGTCIGSSKRQGRHDLRPKPG